MAYAALVSLAQTTDLIRKHPDFLVSVSGRREITSMNEYIIFLQAFLEHFPRKNNRLEGRIRDVVNEAENYIEYSVLKQIRSRNQQISRVKFAEQLQKVTGKIESIAEEVMDVKNTLTISKDAEQLLHLSAANSSSLDAPDSSKDATVGLEKDLTAIKERLCGESSKRRVIPIVGMGGIGKTTLARNTYDDRLIMEHFQIRVWVTVSQDYSAKEILSCIVDSMKEFMAERSGQSNEENVYKTLKGRRYLIVMDDMWSTKAWDDIKMLFPDDANGSRIMITTRLLDVAAHPDFASSPHKMHFMDADQSWNLLQQKVFAQHDCPHDLVCMGKEIARMCRGLPLAIVVIAGLLSMASETPASWDKIAKDVNSAVASKDGQFDKILSLSYTHLPHHLIPCFLYLGGFPEDHEIRVSQLIKLWVAEGFLKCQNRSKSLEEQAEAYLEDLVVRLEMGMEKYDQVTSDKNLISPNLDASVHHRL